MRNQPNQSTPEETIEGGVRTPRRRQFIKGLALPPTVAVLSGCMGEGELNDDTDPIIDDIEEGQTIGYAGALRFGDQYGMRIVDKEDGTEMLSGQFHQENRVIRYTEGNEEVKSYIVDGHGYVVSNDKCIQYPDLSEGSKSISEINPAETEQTATSSDLQVTGTSEIEGEEMFVLEPRTVESEDNGPTVTYYVDATSRYLRRIETESQVIDYYSWGAVDPIDPPSMDCPRQPEV